VPVSCGPASLPAPVSDTGSPSPLRGGGWGERLIYQRETQAPRAGSGSAKNQIPAPEPAFRHPGTHAWSACAPDDRIGLPMTVESRPCRKRPRSQTFRSMRGCLPRRHCCWAGCDVERPRRATGSFASTILGSIATCPGSRAIRRRRKTWPRRGRRALARAAASDSAGGRAPGSSAPGASWISMTAGARCAPGSTASPIASSCATYAAGAIRPHSRKRRRSRRPTPPRGRRGWSCASSSRRCPRSSEK
jgi:hypothetical protein